jgi:hypothetical protein
MDTLMRTLKLVALGGLFIAGAPLAAHAQAPAAEGSRFFFNVSFGGQWREQTFTDSSTFPYYQETGAVAAAHSIGGGTLFDIGVAARVRVPHPLIFGQSRIASATAADLEHSENVVHLQFMWMIPLTSKIDVTVMAGPSFFTVRQTLATVNAPQDISDVPPYETVTITNVSLTDVKDSPVGVNVAIDGNYLITTMKGVGIGVGGFLRFSGASLDLPTTPGMTRDNTDLRAGGPQGALGLRLRY